MAFQELASRTGPFRLPTPLSIVLTDVAEKQRQGIEVISFAGGLPPNDFYMSPDGPVVRDLTEIMNRALSEPKRSLVALQYGASEGYTPLRNMISDLVSQEVDKPVSPDNILITNGLQEGLFIAAYALCDPGDVILMDDPTYAGALSAFQAAGAECWGLATDNEGVLPDAINEAMAIAQMEGKRIRFAYIQAVGNPDPSLLLTSKRGEQLIEISQRANFGLFEDRAYNRIVFDNLAMPAPLINNEPNAIYGGTFSKTIAPGLRLGWLVAPTAMMPALRGLKFSLNLHNNPLSQIAAEEYIRNGNYERNIPIIQALYQRKRDAMVNALRQQNTIRWRFPNAGMFVYGEDTTGHDMVKAAAPILEASNVVYLPGIGCSAPRFIGDSSTRFDPSKTVRINFTNPTFDQIPIGIAGMTQSLARLQA